jgi:uncharacterized protein
METPCTKVCTLDPSAGICIGCGRTLDEIARWGAMDDDERRRIMGNLKQRMASAKVVDQGS